MNAVDILDFVDDVQYIDRGWVNRNHMVVRGYPNWLTLVVEAADRELCINKLRYIFSGEAIRRIETCLSG